MDADDEVDEMFEENKNHLIHFIADQKGDQGREAIDLIMVAKYLERIGDHAADISEITVLMGRNSSVEKFEHIRRMATETMMMLNHSIEAYVQRDTAKAKEVIKHDDIVDDLFDEAKKDVIELILSSPEEGEEATDLLMIAKYFERIGDHATNIAEWVIYSLRTSQSAEEV